MMKMSAPVFQLKVVINEKPIQEYHKDDLTFVEGRQGSNFELDMRNLTGRRLLVHPTVDGLSCMDGKEAAKNDSSQGYVLPPYCTTRIPGWRLSDSEVAAFFFAGEGKSYAEKKGGGRDKGVIACAVWEEKQPEYKIFGNGILRGCNIGGSPTTPSGGDPQQGLPFTTCYHSQTIEPESSHSKGAGGMGVNCCIGGEERTSGKSSSSVMNWAPEPAAQNLGTGFGERTEHQVTTTYFDPATVEPLCVAVIYYDDLEGLKARGIKISGEVNTGYRLPNPFPKDKGCEPPVGWEGGDWGAREPQMAIWLQEAVMGLMKRRIPVERLRVPRRLRNRLHKQHIKCRMILGIPFDFCDGDEIIAESSEEYGRQTARVETR